jgi:sensitive to high expression protein 9
MSRPCSRLNIGTRCCSRNLSRCQSTSAPRPLPAYDPNTIPLPSSTHASTSSSSTSTSHISSTTAASTSTSSIPLPPPPSHLTQPHRDTPTPATTADEPLSSNHTNSHTAQTPHAPRSTPNSSQLYSTAEIHKRISQITAALHQHRHALRHHANTRFTHLSKEANQRLAHLGNEANQRFAHLGREANEKFTILGSRINEVTGYNEIERLKLAVVEKGECCGLVCAGIVVRKVVSW